MSGVGRDPRGRRVVSGVGKKSPASVRERGPLVVNKAKRCVPDPAGLQGGVLGKVCFYKGSICSNTRAM